MYLATLLEGIDNSCAFDDDVLRPEVRKEIEAYLADPRARERKLVKGYYKLLEKSGFHSSEALQKYLADHHIDPMLGKQPPPY
jgi:hypothetical protein